MENKNVVLDIIIEFVKGLKSEDGAIETNINGTMYKIWHCKYLLNQILRQWHTPEDERWYISKKAKELWDKLNVEKPIKEYHYTDKVVCNNETPIEVKMFKGSSNKFDKTTMIKGCSFNFNSVFHEEHIVPISVIMEQLCNLQELNYKNVEEILNKISICRILKEEDKLLNANHSKKNRPCDPVKVLKEIYKQAGIDIFEKKLINF